MSESTPPVPADLSAVVAHSRAPTRIGLDALERPITVDQSNYSVVVDEQVVVKWLLPPVPVPHRGERLLAHLRAVGFDEMPAFVGAEIEHGTVTAMVTDFIPGALDGWDWFVDELTDSPEAALTSAAQIGALTARLHRALATPSTVFPEPLSTATLDDELRRGLGLLDEAMACTAGDAGTRLMARADSIRKRIAALGDAGTVSLQPTHGDLHVGQFLRSGDTLVVNDFDGNPLADAVERNRPRTPLADLAGLLQSIDHVGRIVVNRNPERGADIDAWIRTATDTAERMYRAAWPEGEGGAGPHADAVLAALRTIQELHEFVYAARSLPRWLYVPDAALAAMFPLDEQTPANGRD